MRWSGVGRRTVTKNPDAQPGFSVFSEGLGLKSEAALLYCIHKLCQPRFLVRCLVPVDYTLCCKLVQRFNGDFQRCGSLLLLFRQPNFPYKGFQSCDVCLVSRMSLNALSGPLFSRSVLCHSFLLCKPAQQLNSSVIKIANYSRNDKDFFENSPHCSRMRSHPGCSSRSALKNERIIAAVAPQISWPRYE